MGSDPAFVFEKNCAVLEQTADGKTTGRCWHFLSEGKICPRHGDVSKAQIKYFKTGKLTLESEVRNDHD